jgi:hypothetical protein
MRRNILLLIAASAWACLAQSPGTAKPEQPAKWFKVSGELRSRAEGRTGFNYQPGNDDAYLLTRVRINLSLQPTSWLEGFFQGNDSRAPGLDDNRPMAIFRNTADVRQAYVRIGKAADPVKLTVGRQLLNYGGQRLLGPLDWTNTSRNWDAVKLEIGSASKAKVDLFASTVVQTDQLRRLDQPRRGFNIHGAYGSVANLVPTAVLEPFLLWKTGARASIWTGGFRLASKASAAKALHDSDYQVEIAQQWGRSSATVQHRASAVSFTAGRTLSSKAWKPRISGEYNFGSGDSSPGDATRRTFDHLLGTNHLYYGLVDAVGWQNMHNVRIGWDAKPTRRLQVNVDYHWLWLANASDALYDVAGRATVRPKAGNTARSIGEELDATLVWSVNKQWKAGGGVGHLFAGEFLKQNSPGSGQTFPYVFAQYSF